MNDLIQNNTSDTKEWDNIIDEEIQECNEKINEQKYDIIKNISISQLQELYKDDFEKVFNENLLYGINQYRKENWLNELNLNEDINNSAKIFASYCSRNNQISHKHLYYTTPLERLQKTVSNIDKDISAIWENVFWWQDDYCILDIIDWRKKSSWHNYILLEPNSTDVWFWYYCDEKTNLKITVLQSAKKRKIN